MSDDRDDTLQFDSVVPPPLPAGATVASTGVTCAACRTAIRDDYFDVNGQSVCAVCRARILQHSAPIKGWGTLVRAAVFGTGAAIAGALLYYAVIAITNFEIGLVAIAIGYMVGYSVRAGARGRGGLRLQVLALALTYVAVSLAYGALAIGAALGEIRQAANRSASGITASATGAAPAGNTPPAGTRPGVDTTMPADGAGDEEGPALVGYAALIGLTLALPVMVIFGSLPGGLLSGAIIGFGMMQAWRLTAAPQLHVSGPYRVGTTSVA